MVFILLLTIRFFQIILCSINFWQEQFLTGIEAIFISFSVIIKLHFVILFKGTHLRILAWLIFRAILLLIDLAIALAQCHTFVSFETIIPELINMSNTFSISLLTMKISFLQSFKPIQFFLVAFISKYSCCDQSLISDFKSSISMAKK